MNTFEIGRQHFVLNGKPYRILAGAMHYFRVLPQLWRDRLLKMKACGLNTLETYTCWNLHEPQPGKFDFSGMLDLVRYLQLAKELGLHVIVRPGPYICSEWELGALPPWLLADPGMRLRCLHPAYLAAIERYFDKLIPMLAPLQCTRGGPILMVQVENEYGSFGNDRKYLAWIENALRTRGIDAPLFTSDGPSDLHLQGGTLPHLFKTVNFGSRATESFKKLREYQPDQPLMCAEFWIGWFDHWGVPHHRRNAADAAQALDELLSSGASVSIYMFHGGTTFGFLNGANRDPAGKYLADVSSYDDDAPIDECGDLTAKYWAVRKVIEKYAPLPPIDVPPNCKKKAYGRVELTQRAGLFDSLAQLSKAVERVAPEPMEMLGQNYGFVLYRTQLSGPRVEQLLGIQDVHDRAQVFLDGKPLGVVMRDAESPPIKLSAPAHGATLDILVENMGRINYGPFLLDRKGITEGVWLQSQFQHHWTIYPLPLEDLSRLKFRPADTGEGPAFFRGSFQVDEPADTFLALPGFTKGVCWLNGFNLGRHWKVGPQKTLYIPAPLLKQGPNELVVLELEQADKLQVELREAAELG